MAHLKRKGQCFESRRDSNPIAGKRSRFARTGCGSCGLVWIPREGGEQRLEGDTDILIEFAPFTRITVFDYVGLKDYIGGLIEGPVDVVNRDGTHSQRPQCSSAELRPGTPSTRQEDGEDRALVRLEGLKVEFRNKQSTDGKMDRALDIA